jgi:hypothetical protein
MKISFCLFLIALLPNISFSAACTPASVVAYANSMRDQALKGLDEAFSLADMETDPQQRVQTLKAFAGLKKALAKTPIVKGTAEGCKGSTPDSYVAAYVDGTGPNGAPRPPLYVCDFYCENLEAEISTYFPKEFNGQFVLIHEAAHLDGIRDECPADFWAELAVSYISSKKAFDYKTWKCQVDGTDTRRCGQKPPRQPDAGGDNNPSQPPQPPKGDDQNDPDSPFDFKI